MTLKDILQRTLNSTGFKVARDAVDSTIASAGIPYVLPSFLLSLDDINNSIYYDQAPNAQQNAMNIGCGVGVVSWIGQGFAYGITAVHGSPEYLLIPALTNITSGLYEFAAKPVAKKISRKAKSIKKARKINAEEKKNKISEKLSVKERVTGKKLSTINLKPEINLEPTITVYVNDKKQEDVKVEVSDKKEIKEKTPPLAPYIIKNEPYYESLNGEVKLFETAYNSKLPFMLKGPTGCGKTRFVEHMAYELNKPLITVSCQEDLSATDLAGRILLNEKGTYWQDGPLALAARHGAICYLDEVVEARNDVMVLIHSLTDHRRVLPIDKTGELIEAADDFMLVISYNPHYQSALKEMKPSTRQRFVAMDFDYPERELEAKIVASETGLETDMAYKLTDFARQIRNMKSRGLAEGASTRLLIYAGQLIQSGVNVGTAVDTALISPLTDEQDMYDAIKSVAKDTDLC